MPEMITLILGLLALTLVASAGVLYFRAVSDANGLNFLRWNSLWKTGNWKPTPEQILFRYHLLWVAAVICWTVGTRDWRFRLLYGVIALFFVALLWIRQTRKTRRSQVDRQSLLKFPGEIRA